MEDKLLQGEFRLTPLEEILKRMLALRPDIRDTIPDATGLADYISWMNREYGDLYRSRIDLQHIPIPMARSEQRQLAEQILDRSLDDQVLGQLASGFAAQSEGWNIQTDQDISISRMLRYMPGQWHTSDFFEVFYAPAGPCPIHFEKETIEISRGLVLITAPNVLHASPCYADDAVLYSFIVRRSTFEQVFWNQLPENSLLAAFFHKALSGQSGSSWLSFHAQEDEELFHLCRRMEQQFRQGGIYSRQMLNVLLTEFFIILLEKYEDTARLPRTEQFYWKHEYSAILSYIQTHYADAGIDEIAEQFSYSKRQISRIVKVCLSMSYMQLILKLRMERAAELLKRGHIPIAEIGYQVGYADTSSFNRAFQRYYGKTPTEFKTNLSDM